MKNYEIKHYSTGIPALDRYLSGGVQSGSITQFWMKDERIWLSSVMGNLGASISRAGSRSVIIACFADTPSIPEDISAEELKLIRETCVVKKAKTLVEVIQVLNQIEDQEVAILIDGMTCLPPFRKSHTRLGDMSVLNALEKAEFTLQVMIMAKLQRRKCRFPDLPIVLTTESHQYYRQGGFKYGQAPDFEPIIFSNADYSIQFCLAGNEDFPKEVFVIDHKDPEKQMYSDLMLLADICRLKGHLLVWPWKVY
jgi:hypothetical protein